MYSKPRKRTGTVPTTSEWYHRSWKYKLEEKEKTRTELVLNETAFSALHSVPIFRAPRNSMLDGSFRSPHCSEKGSNRGFKLKPRPISIIRTRKGRQWHRQRRLIHPLPLSSSHFAAQIKNSYSELNLATIGEVKTSLQMEELPTKLKGAPRAVANVASFARATFSNAVI